jgi:sulfonate transport system ATP-binding protein
MQISHVEETRVSQAAGGSVKGAHLVLRGLHKRYGERSVLEAVNLKIVPGEFLAVVGRSGCGKSTLLRAIAGLEKPDGGQVKIGGGGARPEVRMMFQDARLLPWKTTSPSGWRTVGSGRARPWTASACCPAPAIGRRCCRADSGSGWRWRVRWCTSRNCCCSTNRWAPSTR